MNKPTDPQGATSVQVRRQQIQPIEVFADDDALLNLRTAGTWSSLSESTIRRAEAAGELTLVRLSKRCTRVRAGELRRFLKAKGGAL